MFVHQYNISFNCQGNLHQFRTPIIMGIVNATPDSFYHVNAGNTLESMLSLVTNMIHDGATIIDIGGMSSKPGATEVSEKEEAARIMPLIEAIRSIHPHVLLSVDTYRSTIAKQAIRKGVNIINDIKSARDNDDMIKVAVAENAPYVSMHMQGTPQTMQINPTYSDVVKEVLNFFSKKASEFSSQGLVDWILDVGFGFGKTIEHNYQLLKHLHVFQLLEKPILVGLSRKSMIYKPLDTNSTHALNGTTALHMLALQQGASILRVHDVKEARECIALHLLYEGRN